MESSILPSVSLEAGLAAIQQERHQDAIGILEAFCHDCAAQAEWANRSYLQAQMHLVKTYAKNAQIERAVILCERLAKCNHAQVQIWAQQTLQTLRVEGTQEAALHDKRANPFSLFQLKNILLLFRELRR